MQTVSYLRICLVGTIFIYLYNVMAALLRGIGDSMIPMAGRKYNIFNLRNVRLKIQKNILSNVVKIGLPQAIQFTLTNISFLLVLVLVNHYGNTASAISVSVTRLSSFAVLAGQAVMGAIINSFAVRYALAKILSALTPLGFLGIALAYPFAPVCSCIVCMIFLSTGRWKRSRVKL